MLWIWQNLFPVTSFLRRALEHACEHYEQHAEQLPRYSPSFVMHEHLQKNWKRGASRVYQGSHVYPRSGVIKVLFWTGPDPKFHASRHFCRSRRAKILILFLKPVLLLMQPALQLVMSLSPAKSSCQRIHITLSSRVPRKPRDGMRLHFLSELPEGCLRVRRSNQSPPS